MLLTIASIRYLSVCRLRRIIWIDLCTVGGDLQQVFGRNLRSYRLSQALSQEAFADVWDLHRTYIGAIERGTKNLSLRTVERLADRLGLSPLALLRPPTAAPATTVVPTDGGRSRASGRQSGSEA